MDNDKPNTDIFIIMPFGSKQEYSKGIIEAEYIYNEIIYKGVKLAFDSDLTNVHIKREVDKNKSGSITKSIIQHLATADIVIAELTGQNPNVFLELGIRYSLRSKGTLIMTQNPKEIPFDIRDYRCIAYDQFEPEQARLRIANFIKEIVQKDAESDSVVFDTFKNMSVKIPQLIESFGPESSSTEKGILPWFEYEARVQFVTNLLEGPMKDGRYTPDIIIGISNGGYIVADLIGRKLFSGKPILGLWANRISVHGSRYRFFDNAYNNALCIEVQKSRDSSKEPLDIVLVDDHFGYGNTSEQAIVYLKDKLGEDTKILFLPLLTGRIQALEAVEKYLPYTYSNKSGKIFNISKEEYLKHVHTSSIFFPYMLKQINQG